MIKVRCICAYELKTAGGGFKKIPLNAILDVDEVIANLHGKSF